MMIMFKMNKVFIANIHCMLGYSAIEIADLDKVYRESTLKMGESI